MLTDGRQVATGTEIRVEVCIVGAGAAGITLARALARRGIRVALIESGGFDNDPDTRELSHGENIGIDYFALKGCRQRFFGGTTDHWAGFCRPLDDLDFEGRAWVPDSGWPITRSELENHYRRALPILELRNGHFDAEFWVKTIRSGLLPLDPQFMESVAFQLSPPTQFGKKYRDEIVADPRIELLIHSNVIEIETDDGGGSVTGVRVASLSGRRFRVFARNFVVATGGIENARILLASASAAHPTGLGNHHDNVGRYFMDHPHFDHALLMPSSKEFHGAFFHAYRGELGGFLGALRFSRELLTHETLNNVIFSFSELERIDDDLAAAKNSAAAIAYEHLARHLKDWEWPSEFSESVFAVIRDWDAVSAAQRPHVKKPDAGVMYRVYVRTEQQPNPNSRVRLGEQRDALGVKRVRLDWQLNEADYRTLYRAHELLAREMGAAGLGRLHFPQSMQKPWLDRVRGGCHHMGTTRMHDDPTRGVVGSDCRVHGISNLFVAGSSVFPTSGCANPTFTIIALALRLGDRLASANAREHPMVGAGS